MVRAREGRDERHTVDYFRVVVDTVFVVCILFFVHILLPKAGVVLDTVLDTAIAGGFGGRHIETKNTVSRLWWLVRLELTGKRWGVPGDNKHGDRL